MKIYRYDAQKNQYEDASIIKIKSSRYKYLVIELMVSDDHRQLINVSATSLIAGNKAFKNVITCFNPTIELEENQAKSVFIGFDLLNVPFGEAKSVIKIANESVGIIIEVDDSPVFFNGTDDPSSLSRLKFLNSNICNNKELLEGFKGISANKNTVNLWGKQVVFGKNGLIEDVISYFDESNSICEQPQKNLFFKECFFNLLAHDLNYYSFKLIPFERYANVSAKAKSAKLAYDVHAKLWYDGGISYTLTLVAEDDVVINNFGLNMHFKSCRYRLNNYLGSFSEILNDKDIALPSYFIGDVNCGSKVSFYLDESSWNNYGKGSISINDDPNGATLIAQTGMLIIPKGKTLQFKFDLMLTPIKPISIKEQFDVNVFSKGLISKTYGQNYTVISRLPIANFIYPYKDELKAAVFSAHKEEVGIIIPFKINYIDPENVDYRLFKAIDVKNYDNYNLELLSYLINEICIDGVLLDSSCVTRESAERCAKLFQKRSKKSIIELLNDYGGNSLDKMKSLMEILPFAQRLVIKNAVYDNPDYILCELSGLPFGILSESADKGVNPIMALLFGMKIRLGSSYEGNDMMANAILKLFHELKLNEGRIRGYWDSENPMTSDNESIFITSYLNNDTMLAAIYNFSDKIQTFNLGINPKKNFTSVGKIIETPLILGLQKREKLNLNKPIKLKARKGMLVTIKK